LEKAGFLAAEILVSLVVGTLYYKSIQLLAKHRPLGYWGSMLLTAIVFYATAASMVFLPMFWISLIPGEVSTNERMVFILSQIVGLWLPTVIRYKHYKAYCKAIIERPKF
jgi:biotin transporter BioY